MAERLNSMFAEAGLPFKPDLEKVPNSRKSLALGELAHDRGVHDALHPQLFDAYWARGLDLGDSQVLRQEGGAVGLEAGDVDAALEDPRYRERVAEQTGAALELGASGVPAWVIDDRALVPGAQPHDVFDHVLGRLGYEPGG
jgi:predicted DsbA family dithiol-disulfide isomerase